jgi:uncharacterized protein YegL
MTQVVELDINKQYILAGDVSGSMQTPDPLCSNATRYDYMLEKFKAFIKEAESFDPDGPSVILFGQDVKSYKNVTLEQVQDKLSNPVFEGFTMTHLAINEAYNIHKAEKAQLAANGKAHIGTVVMVFTDGAPTSRPELEKSIVRIANEIDRDEEFSIIFLTVGTIPADLQDFLTHLDDDLKGKAKFDIVDVKKLEEVTFLKAVDGAMND